MIKKCIKKDYTSSKASKPQLCQHTPVGVEGRDRPTGRGLRTHTPPSLEDQRPHGSVRGCGARSPARRHPSLSWAGLAAARGGQAKGLGSPAALPHALRTPRIWGEKRRHRNRTNHHQQNATEHRRPGSSSGVSARPGCAPRSSARPQMPLTSKTRCHTDADRPMRLVGTSLGRPRGRAAQTGVSPALPTPPRAVSAARLSTPQVLGASHPAAPFLGVFPRGP